MSGIRAVVVDPDAPNRLALADVEEPSPTPSEVLVRVSAVSLNRGEVRRAGSSEPGFRPGWDLAGTVERAAADGSGPQEGSRVVGFLPSGAWAELAAVPTDSVAFLADGVSFEEASTLPVAGLTALYALEEGETCSEGTSWLRAPRAGPDSSRCSSPGRQGRGWSGSCAGRSM